MGYTIFKSVGDAEIEVEQQMKELDINIYCQEDKTLDSWHDEYLMVYVDSGKRVYNSYIDIPLVLKLQHICHINLVSSHSLQVISYFCIWTLDMPGFEKISFKGQHTSSCLVKINGVLFRTKTLIKLFLIVCLQSDLNMERLNQCSEQRIMEN